MSVESFDPDALRRFEVSDAVLAALLAAAQAQPPTFGLAEIDVRRLAPAVQAEPWQDRLAELADEQLVALSRLFTLAEDTLTGWGAGAGSVVIPMVAELRRRDACPPELIGWIKANTTNRFLPYGNLMDRL